jgi:hypothetical protein
MRDGNEAAERAEDTAMEYPFGRSFSKWRLNRPPPLCENQKRLWREDRDFYKVGIRRLGCPIRKSSDSNVFGGNRAAVGPISSKSPP